MPYRLYLKKSFQKRSFRHFVFFAILVCTMIIPLLMTVYRSSHLEGHRQYVYEYTRGAVFQMDNAREEDLAAFAEVEGVDAVFEDGSIWFYPAEDWYLQSDEEQAVYYGFEFFDEHDHAEAMDDHEEFAHDHDGHEHEHEHDHEHDHEHGDREPLGVQLQEIAESLGREESGIWDVSDFGKDESFDDMFRQEAIIDWSLTGLCLLIFLSACGNHIRRFRPDIGSMRAAGAARSQIVMLFWGEFLITAVPAALLAVIAAEAEMRLLYRSFIEVKGSILSWNVFHVDFEMIRQHVAVFLTAGSLFTILYTLRLCHCGILSLIREETPQRSIRRTILGITRGRSPEGMISSILLRRGSRALTGCAFITLIAITIVSLTINYLTVNSIYIQKAPAYEVSVVTPYFDAGIPDECISAIMQMEEVETADSEPSLYYHSYLTLDSRLTGISESYWDGVGGALTMIRNAKETYPDLNETMDSREVIVAANFTGLPYKPGDSFTLQPTDYYEDEEGSPHPKAPVHLKVAGLADLPPNDEVMTVFLKDTFYEALVRDLPVGEINLKLKDPAAAPDVVRKLTEAYPILNYSITDYYTPFLEMRRIHTGQVVMYSTLIGLMLLSLFCILFFRNMEHLAEQKSIRKTLRSIGASHTMVRKAYSRQIFAVFAASTVTALLAGYWLLRIYLFYTGNHHYFTPLNIALHAAAIALTGLVYAFPIHLIFNKKTAKEGCNNG